MLRKIDHNQGQKINFLSLTLVAIAFSSLFLDIFALQIVKGFYLSFGFLIVFCSVAYFLAKGLMGVNLLRVALLVLFLLLALYSLAVNDQRLISTNSLALLIVFYIPLLFTLSAEKLPLEYNWKVLNLFLNFGLILALFGICQFFMQFLIKSPAVIDPSLILPSWLVDHSDYNTSNPISSFYKSNGFFTREPSILSIALSIVILIEVIYYCRILRLAILSTSLLLSFSGSGLMILLVGCLFRLGNLKNTIYLLLCVFLISFIGYLFKDSVVVEYFVTKSMTFSQPGTSAYARFVAPTAVITESFNSGLFKIVFGNGAGSYARYVDSVMVTSYGIHGPTWGKLLVEYGILGTVIMLGLIISVLKNISLPLFILCSLLYAWLASGGQLLNFNFLIFLYAIQFFPPIKDMTISIPENIERRYLYGQR